MSGDPLLDYLEKTFADAYRKEIDQEENVWRSLPFFAATLALQLAALVPVREWVSNAEGPAFWIATCLLASSGVATISAILCLALSVWPADFEYVTPEPMLRDYADRVRAAAEEATGTSEERAALALRSVKSTLAEQYAVAVTNNRSINWRRSRWRTRAGLATLASVSILLVLVALVVVSNVNGHARQRADNSSRPVPAVGGERPVSPASRDQAASDDRGA